MTPEQFLDRLQKNGPEPVYLFLGPEAYHRERCRAALLEAVLALREDRESGFTPRTIWIRFRWPPRSTTRVAVSVRVAACDLAGARRSGFAAGQACGRGRGDAARATRGELEAYLREPTPGTVVVIESQPLRFRRRGQSPAGARAEVLCGRPGAGGVPPVLAGSRASAGAEPGEAGWPATGLRGTGAAARSHRRRRVAHRGRDREAELVTPATRKVTADDIAALVPDAQAATIFALVAALGRGDRATRAGDSGHAGARRRIHAAGADVSGHAIPHGAGGARGGTARRGTDSGALHQAGRAHLAARGRGRSSRRWRRFRKASWNARW